MSSEESSPIRIELDLGSVPLIRQIEQPGDPVSTSLATRLREMPEVSEIIGLANRFAGDPEKAFALYNEDPFTLYGKLIGGDDLVGILRWTARNPLLSYRFSGEALASLPMRMFRKRMAMPVASSNECVLITMGMPACGKTTLVKGGMGRAFHTIVDSPLSSFDTARELRRLARESGRKVAFVYAHRSLADAVRGMLERALPWREGRTVTLEHMGSILVKGLSLFLQLAESNSADKETTLDLVDLKDGRRTWWSGAQAAQRVEEIRHELSSQGTSVLAQLARHWVAALRESRQEGLDIPELLVELVQEELDPRLLQEAEQWEGVDMPASHCESSEFQGTVRSLSDRPEMQRNIDRWLESADCYEATLRNWRITGNGPKGMPVSDPAEELDHHEEDWEPHRVNFRSERGYQAYLRLLDARCGFSSGAWDQFAPTPERREEAMFWFLMQDDPLMQAWDGLPEGTKGAFPPLKIRHTTPGSVGVLEERMERLRRIAAVFLRDEKTLLKVLMRM
ncbi:MAG: hypothetical protein IPN59_12620 [Holophaga sp.]|nr:hypothetical protein [Holophaga sp.]